MYLKNDCISACRVEILLLGQLFHVPHNMFRNFQAMVAVGNVSIIASNIGAFPLNDFNKCAKKKEASVRKKISATGPSGDPLKG